MFPQKSIGLKSCSFLFFFFSHSYSPLHLFHPRKSRIYDDAWDERIGDSSMTISFHRAPRRRFDFERTLDHLLLDRFPFDTAIDTYIYIYTHLYLYIITDESGQRLVEARDDIDADTFLSRWDRPSFSFLCQLECARNFQSNLIDPSLADRPVPDRFSPN